MAGDAKAPTVVVAYACATCPACGRVTPWLYEQVTQGAWRGKARLYFRPFPLRGHPNSREANLGFVAAARLGKFWPFMLAHYKDDQPWDSARQKAHAAAAGIDAKRFAFLLNNAETEQQLIDARKEGLRHPIEATPTLFIDGQRYTGKTNPEELVRAIK